MKYRQRSEEIEAVRVPAPRDPVEAMPPWVLEAFIKRVIRVEADGSWIVSTVNLGDVIARPGDYVTYQWKSARLQVFGPREFVEKYEPQEKADG